jgi:hypothetical protein
VICSATRPTTYSAHLIPPGTFAKNDTISSTSASSGMIIIPNWPCSMCPVLPS